MRYFKGYRRRSGYFMRNCISKGSRRDSRGFKLADLACLEGYLMDRKRNGDYVENGALGIVSITDKNGDEVIHQNSHMITGKKLRMTFNWRRVVGGKFRIYIWEPGYGDKWKLWKAFDGIDQAEAEYKRLMEVM